MWGSRCGSGPIGSGRGQTGWAWPNEGDGYAVVGVAWRGGRDLERWAWPSGSRKSPRQHLRRWAWPPLGGGRGQEEVGVARREAERCGRCGSGAVRMALSGRRRTDLSGRLCCAGGCGAGRGRWGGRGEGGGAGTRSGHAHSAEATPPRCGASVEATPTSPPWPRLFWSRPAAARSCSGHAHLAVATPPS